MSAPVMPGLEYRTCCDHPDCTTCKGHGGFYRMTKPVTGECAALLPCPFCGSANIEKDAWSSLSAEGPGCDDCGATAESAEAWNRRAANGAGGQA